MFGGKQPNYTKLRTNLRLCINRLKLLEKKKAELALKARKEIADYIQNGKQDRARIRVEHIVREDYLVEAMEIIEMFCDLILARFGLIDRMKELDPGLEESIASIIWVTPRLCSDVAELREVTKQFTLKYGKEYAEACSRNTFENVNEKVIHKLSLAAPPKLLIENYMVEIARAFKVPFEPDPFVMSDDSVPEVSDLLDLANEIGKPPDEKPGFGGGSGGGGGGGGGGGMGVMMPLAPSVYPPGPAGSQMQPPPTVVYPTSPGGPNNAPVFTVPGSQPPGYSPSQAGGVSPGAPPLPGKPPNSSLGNSPVGSAGSSPCNDAHSSPANPNQPHVNISGSPALPNYDDVMNSPTQFPSAGNAAGPPGLFPGPGQGLPPAAHNPAGLFPGPGPGLPPAGRSPSPGLPLLPDVPGLPSVPSSTIGTTAGDEVDFDDLTRRFEELKKRK